MIAVLFISGGVVTRSHYCTTIDPVDESHEVALQWYQEAGGKMCDAAQDDLLSSSRIEMAGGHCIQIVEITAGRSYQTTAPISTRKLEVCHLVCIVNDKDFETLYQQVQHLFG